MQNYIIWSYLVLRDLDIWGETLCNSSYEHVDLVMWSFEGKKHSIPFIHGSLLDSMNSRDLWIVFHEMHLLHQHLMQGFILFFILISATFHVLQLKNHSHGLPMSLFRLCIHFGKLQYVVPVHPPARHVDTQNLVILRFWGDTTTRMQIAWCSVRAKQDFL